MPDAPPEAGPISLFEEIFPGDTNAYGTAFGGRILALMDRAAGLAASRYARCDFVTASLDALDFRAPVKQGQIAEVEAELVYTSEHTCGVRVRVFAHDKQSWQRRPCCAGMLFMVAVGPDGRPLPVPRLAVADERAQRLWQAAAAIHRRMLERRSGDEDN
jgi:acyl-CoA hydrolase